MVCNLLSVDGSHDPDVVALNAASASLAASDVPWNGPVGAVRVGHVAGRGVVVSPTRRDMAGSALNLLVSGDAEGRVLMLEAEADDLDRALFLEAVEAGLESCSSIARSIRDLFADVRKREVLEVQEIPEELRRAVHLLCRQRVKAIYCDYSHDKTSRDVAAFAVRDSAIESLAQEFGGVPNFYALVNDCFGKLCRDLVSELVFDEGKRVDGRGRLELRPISCEADLHPPLHGSALFQRGQTQVIFHTGFENHHEYISSPSSPQGYVHRCPGLRRVVAQVRPRLRPYRRRQGEELLPPLRVPPVRHQRHWPDGRGGLGEEGARPRGAGGEGSEVCHTKGLPLYHQADVRSPGIER